MIEIIDHRTGNSERIPWDEHQKEIDERLKSFNALPTRIGHITYSNRRLTGFNQNGRDMKDIKKDISRIVRDVKNDNKTFNLSVGYKLYPMFGIIHNYGVSVLCRLDIPE